MDLIKSIQFDMGKREENRKKGRGKNKKEILA